MYRTRPGNPEPLGATVNSAGVNFSLFSENATRVELLLFAHASDAEPIQVVNIERPTLFYWHVQVDGLPEHTPYAYRVHGPSGEEVTRRFGHRFNGRKVLLDPYALGNVDSRWSAEKAKDDSDNVGNSLRSVVIAPGNYDWEGDIPPNIPRADTILYELHVRGYTQSPSSGVAHPGTFAGLIEKLPYIKQLGVTSVELMPVFDFDEKTVKRLSPVTGLPLTNFWGYDPISFFAPQSAYCVEPEAARHVDEFRDFVKAAHRLGLEVILDVVYNHTGEEDEKGPMISFKGIDNSVFYFLDPDDKRIYNNQLTGCPNALRCNHPFVSKMITESLAYWVSEMHVDGFRFDLGAVLTLGEDTRQLQYPPVVWAVNLDSRFANTKIIIEPFGGHQGGVLGSFPNIRSSSWNFRFKNDIRRFVRGDPGITAEIATRLCGSSDIFQQEGFHPLNGVSYVTCHDGFTLNDVVSYNTSHNEANGEESGDKDNLSCNYGVEGPAADPSIEALRERQIRNFLAMLFLAQGVPMLLAGDECRRTQRGNNNPYLQDNAVSWFDWTLVNRHSDLVAYTRFLIDFRKRHPSLRRHEFFQGVPCKRGLLDVSFHGCMVGKPGFNDPNSRVLALTIADPGEGEDIHAIFNMEQTPLTFELPNVEGRRWHRAVDTALPPPQTFVEPPDEVPVTKNSYYAAARSVVILVSKPVRV